MRKTPAKGVTPVQLENPEVRRKASRTRKQRRDQAPTEKERQFAEQYVLLDCNSRLAAEAVGLKFPHVEGSRFLNKPRVKAYVEKLLSAVEKKEVAKASTEIVKTRKVERAQILERLWELASLSPEDTNCNINGQVGALKELGEILGMKVKQVRDVTKTFEGWTEDELEHYARTGTVPQRFSGNASSSPTPA